MKSILGMLMRWRYESMIDKQELIEEMRDPNTQYHKPQIVYEEYKKPVESKRKMRKRKGKK